MACEVCQHCMSPVIRTEARVREGNSYHEECHKCYVCSETDLRNAEVFKGVIFCAGCAKRIFQGCSTARQAKLRPRRRPRRRRSIERGVIERARLARSSTKALERDGHSDSHSSGHRADGTDRPRSPLPFANRQSIECGVSTDVTCPDRKNKMHDPIVIESAMVSKTRAVVWPKISKGFPSNSKKKEVLNLPAKKSCSDLRIAELGASTEIASMALRKQSGAMINKSESNIKSSKAVRSSVSALSQVSDISEDESDSHMELVSNVYPGASNPNRPILNRPIRSLLKLPYALFKKNIVMRSSLISVIMSSNNEKDSFYRRFKMLFHEEIVEHQHHGLKILYSTINRRKTPYKMGWLDSLQEVPKALRESDERNQLKPVCKHFDASHSYRCMRARVMRLAGPTKSEMKIFRRKVKNTIVPPSFVRMIKMLNKRYATMMSTACGSEVVELQRPVLRVRSI